MLNFFQKLFQAKSAIVSVFGDRLWPPKMFGLVRPTSSDLGKNYVETSFGLRFRPVSSGSNSPEKKIGAVAAGFPKTLFGTSESGAVLGAKVTFLRDSDLD